MPPPEITSNDSLVPVMGHRFILHGDFDGDGHPDTLTEHFFSGIDHRETNKYFKNVDYDQQVRLNDQRNPFCFVSSSNGKIDTLPVSGGPLFGLSWLKNEGDLNGDGTDEVSYVINLADWSNLNHCTLVTYRHHRWEELYRFAIWDSQLPDPSATGKPVTAVPELIRKIRPGKIMVWFENKGEQDSAIVRLH
jgi:hypothetical protein